MKKFLKVILIIFIWLIITGLLVGGAVLLDLPVAYALYGAAGLFVLWLVIVIIRKSIVRMRARRQVENLIGQELPSEKSSGKTSSFPFTLISQHTVRDTLGKKIKSLVTLLQNSQLKNQGDPLYVLPWFIMIGPRKSGKHTTLSNAKLPAPIFEQEPLKSEGCSCWPYNHGVIINTPGDYMAISDEISHKEWLRLLQLLTKYRSKEPVNGVIVTVDAEWLINEDEQVLFEKGREHRMRIDEVMTRLKIQVPVYFLITKCNLLEGFKEIADILPAQSLDQAMGYAFSSEAFLDNGQLAIEKAIPEAFESIVEKVKDLLIVGISRVKAKPNLLLLPHNLEKLKDKLQFFTNGAFQENPFQESPLLKGLYLSGVNPDQDARKIKIKSFFLHDFFTKILPADRSKLATFTPAMKTDRIIKGSVMSGWGMVVLLFLIFMLWSYSSSLSFFEEKTQEIAGSLVSQGSFNDNLRASDQLRTTIFELEEEIAGWWFPWFGFWEKPLFLEKMKTIYTQRFRDDLLKPMNKEMIYKVSRAISGDMNDSDQSKKDFGKLSNKEISNHIDTFVKRINMLNAVTQGANEDAIKTLPPSFGDGDLYFPIGTDPMVLDTFNRLYVQLLVWPHDNDLIEEETVMMRSYLKDYLSAVGNDFSWITILANSKVKPNPDLNLSTYWTGSKVLTPEIVLPSAYSLEGREFIFDFLDQLQATDPESKEMKEIITAYQKNYQDGYFKAWEEFIYQFGTGTNTLLNRDEWVDMINVIGSAKNPFFHFLDVMGEQFQPFAASEELPEWVELTLYFQEMKAFDPNAPEGSDSKVMQKMALKIVNKLGPLGKAISKSAKTGLKTQKKLSSGKTPDDRSLALEATGSALGDYRKALTDIAFNANARAISYNAMITFFANPEEPGAGDGPDAAAYKSILELYRLLGNKTRENEPFWTIYQAPLEVAWNYMLKETACSLQDRWNNKFLVEIDGVPKFKIGGLVFAQGGMLWSFLDNDMGPFMQKQYRKGYVPARVRDKMIPLRPEFTTFIARGWETSKSTEVEKISLQFPTHITYCW